jgi:hypothetical protein
MQRAEDDRGWAGGEEQTSRRIRGIGGISHFDLSC